jgi:ADP-ribose pyrophosphatase YjhB (NUDIX family)
VSEPPWLAIARELAALAQAGLAFSRDAFDRERYTRTRELAARLMAEGAGDDGARVLELFRQDTGYPTPKVDVRGAVFRDGRVLLVREASDGLWSLPGGWADVNQSAAECVAREIREESGFEALPRKLAAVLDYRRQGHRSPHPYSIYKLFFICELAGGAPLTGIETTDLGFFARDALPELSLGRVTQRQVERMFVHADRPELPTEFD